MTTEVSSALSRLDCNKFLDIRHINGGIRNAAAEGGRIAVDRPEARHNLAVAPGRQGSISIFGSVGAFCGAQNTGAVVHVHGSAGWGVAEGMAEGFVRVDGSAAAAAGAAMSGGVLHIRGSAGPRAGAVMSGGAIVVEGHLGTEAAQWARGGTLVGLGNAGPSAGAAMQPSAELWVRGTVVSLGPYAVAATPTAVQRERLRRILGHVGTEVSGTAAFAEWTLIVSSAGHDDTAEPSARG
ncbi:hypothetical protein [Mycobacterium sp. 852013-50091_SCH5140682]|uniref:GltB/FmdC/FwdC-like GXGXG domain-containing protein n=1 Tax=Mycobacterium sp. 852013-50091_SCH5140682 TaxID=1834109 RepID=UPI000A46F124|nr:hypothetical protein [Mycobacterium sp. 852013-50091_SCH5140682]